MSETAPPSTMGRDDPGEPARTEIFDRRREHSNDDQLLTPGQVARLFGVDPKTVTRWADLGKLQARHTLGGHRRYLAREVSALLEQRREDG